MNKSSKKYKNGRTGSKMLTNSSSKPINLKIRTSAKNMFNVSDYLLSSRSGLRSTKAMTNMNESVASVDAD